MQKRKFDELISHFNRKVSDMSIDQKYKMELLGMISAIGFAHEKELGTNLAEVGTDCISRQAAIEMCREPRMRNADCSDFEMEIMMLPPIQSDIPYIISETLHECGIYGEEATVKLIGTLKRLRRDDLLPPCVR